MAKHVAVSSVINDVREGYWEEIEDLTDVEGMSAFVQVRDNLRALVELDKREGKTNLNRIAKHIKFNYAISY